MTFKSTLLQKKPRQNEQPIEDPILIKHRRQEKQSRLTLCYLLVIFPLLPMSMLIYGRLASYNYGEADVLPVHDIFKRNVIRELWETNFGPFLSNYYFGSPKVVQQPDIPDSNLPNPPLPTGEKCYLYDADKFDCLPRGDVTEENCHSRGCCYSTSPLPHVPYCFYPKDYNSYKYTNVNKSDFGYTAELTQLFKSPFPKDLPKLSFTAKFLSDEVLSVTITDDKTSRYQFPFPEPPNPSAKKLDSPLYDIQVDPDSTGFKVIRKSSKRTIFDTENVGGFTFSDQMIQISARLPTNNIFGIGESRHPFKVGTDWRIITLHNHDAIPTNNINGYGLHPVYMGLEPDGLAHGVYLMSTYSMDIALQPSPAITYRVIGGPLTFYFLLGPKPIDVNVQYVNIIGKPYLPPYWALGFHLCRYGYKSLDEMKKIYNQTRAAGIPYDVQWTDLDYMKDHNDFTLSDSFKELPKFVDELHNVGMHYVVLIDPGVSGSESKGTYPPLDVGLEKDIFVKDPNGKGPLYGRVWNLKSTVFPDFTHPQVVPYWNKMISDFHKLVPIDGAWIDMNEPSNMVDGSLNGCPTNNLDNPPYVPYVDNGKLSYRTICMSSKHHIIEHYAVHNVYASLEAVLTHFAMMNARDGKRTLVISRASSPGIGVYSGHWTGDVISSWDDMVQSIPDMFSFNLFGIPLVGADICGFNGNTNKDLCARWTQLGAFYPFSRNHNSDDQIAQDPVSLGIQETAKIALTQRYFYLPYLYTLFWEAHDTGLPVVRPTFYIDPLDEDTHSLEGQFFWGDGLLIAPALKQGFTYVTPYLPKGRWYHWNFNQTSATAVDSDGKRVAVEAPVVGPVPILLRGGKIFPCQIPGQTTTESRKNPFVFVVALDSSNSASGNLYVDDGETFDGGSNQMEFVAKNGTLEYKIVNWLWEGKLNLQSVYLLGKFGDSFHGAFLNGQPMNYTIYNESLVKIDTKDTDNKLWDLKKEFKLNWTTN